MLKLAARRLLLSFCLLSAVAVSGVAQDAGQVLRLSVGYNTLKNTATLNPEQQREVEQLGDLARQAGAAGNYGDAIKHLHHAMALMRGTPWTPLRALNHALILEPFNVVSEPGQMVKVRVKHLYTPDQLPEGKLSGSVYLLKTEANKQIKLMDIGTKDFNTIILTSVGVVVPNIEDGNYRLVISFTPATNTPQPPAGAVSTITAANADGAGNTNAAASINVRIARGVTAKATALQTRLTTVKSKLLDPKQKEATQQAAISSIEYRVSLIDLANRGKVNPERINFEKELGEADQLLRAVEERRDPFAARRGDLRKAYRSEVDNTLQPYRVFVPATYDTAKRYPLIIALHGMGGDENSYFDSYLNGAFKQFAEERGYLVACPKGRETTSMYQGAAERDVMDVIAEMKAAYRVDEKRIYLTGHSMGGFGTWSIAMNHPGVFAALAPVAGGGNPLKMTQIKHIPQLVVHGDNDRTVPVNLSRMMVEAAKKLGTEVKYLEIKGGDHVKVAAMTFKDVFDWFDSHQQQQQQDTKAKAAGASATSQ